MKSTTNFWQKSPRYELRIAGSGGQGIVLASIILAEAALLDGRCVAQSQNYGPEARGGNSVSEVVISDTEIDYPLAVELDLLVALTQEACDRNLSAIKEGGAVIVDSSLVTKVPWENVASLPFSRIAQKAGDARAINMAALGAVTSFCPIISPESVIRAMAKRLPATKVEINRQAFREALQIAQNLKTEPKTSQREAGA
ncbi:MAG: 2-oxoacid:ferredoxin oxidoreductase subunit gamma [Dehalococcoidia bacterium]|nr:MAG: 2-oxoacid:ferredoxin oxidoreductase subunit gamma [Dehalococcoidia bacterium]